jgi:septum site-determining protein MinC
MMAQPTKQPPAFILRGRMLSLTVLRLFTLNLGEIEDRLLIFKEQAPELFNRLPLILDVEEVLSKLSRQSITDLLRLLKSYGFLPIAIQGGDVQTLKELAVEDLHILSHAASQEAAPVPMPASQDTHKILPASSPSNADCYESPLLIEKQVRSGQQIYAQGRDLIVLASVSPGAEVLADGHIHIYGALQGRALAGVQGNAEARIFCQELNAELISIAGSYRLYDSLPHGELRSRPVQVLLEGDRLLIDFMKK